jgi:hypothetical protein
MEVTFSRNARISFTVFVPPVAGGAAALQADRQQLKRRGCVGVDQVFNGRAQYMKIEYNVFIYKLSIAIRHKIKYNIYKLFYNNAMVVGVCVTLWVSRWGD